MTPLRAIEVKSFGRTTHSGSISFCLNSLRQLSEIQFPTRLADAISVGASSRSFVEMVLNTSVGRKFLREHLNYNPRLISEDDLNSRDPLFAFLASLNEWGEAESFLNVLKRVHSRVLVTMGKAPLAHLPDVIEEAVGYELHLRELPGLTNLFYTWRRSSKLPPRGLVRKSGEIKTPSLALELSSNRTRIFSHYELVNGGVVAKFHDGAPVHLGVRSHSRRYPYRFSNGNILFGFDEYPLRGELRERSGSTFAPAKSFMILTPAGRIIHVKWPSDQVRPSRWLHGTLSERYAFGIEFVGFLPGQGEEENAIAPYVYLYQLNADGRSSKSFRRLYFSPTEEQMKARYVERNFRILPLKDGYWRLFIKDEIVGDLVENPETELLNLIPSAESP